MVYNGISASKGGHRSRKSNKFFYYVITFGFKDRQTNVRRYHFHAMRGCKNIDFKLNSCLKGRKKVEFKADCLKGRKKFEFKADSVAGDH